MSNEFQRKQFTFYSSFLDGVEELPEEEQGPFLLALVRYALRGAEPKLKSPMTRMAFKLIRPNLDSSRKKSIANSKDSTDIPQGNLEVTSRKPRSNQEDSHSPTPLIEKEKKVEKEYKTNGAKSERQNKSTPKYRPEWFERFWELYPNKKAKVDAAKAWDKLSPSLDLCKIMTEALKRQMQSDQWKNTRFVPLPATWLNGERWLDKVDSGGRSNDSELPYL